MAHLKIRQRWDKVRIFKLGEYCSGAFKLCCMREESHVDRKEENPSTVHSERGKFKVESLTFKDLAYKESDIDISLRS